MYPGPWVVTGKEPVRMSPTHTKWAQPSPLSSTLVDSAPYASLLIVLVTTWLGTATSEVEETPIPGRISLTARVKDQQERSLAKDPIPSGIATPSSRCSCVRPLGSLPARALHKPTIRAACSLMKGIR